MDRFVEILEECDTDFLLFTQTICGYCNRAKNVLNSKNLTYSEINFDHEDNLRTEVVGITGHRTVPICCLLYTSPSPRDGLLSRMPSSA